MTTQESLDSGGLRSIQIGISARGIKTVTRDFKTMDHAVGRVNRSVSLFQKLMFATFGSAAVRLFNSFSDAFVNIQNRIRIVTDSMRQLTKTTNALFKISNDTRSSFGATAELYVRLAQDSRDLGLNQEKLLTVTKAVNQATILSGASAHEAAGGIRQLTQGLSKGVLNGEELRSVMENLRVVADVIAKQMGVTRGELLILGEAGKITADVVVEGFLNAADTLDSDFKKTVRTTGQALTVLQTTVTKVIGEFGQSTGAADAMANAIISMAHAIEWAAQNTDTLVISMLTLKGVLLATKVDAASMTVTFASFFKNFSIAGKGGGMFATFAASIKGLFSPLVKLFSVFGGIPATLGIVTSAIVGVVAVIVGLGLAFSNFIEVTEDGSVTLWEVLKETVFWAFDQVKFFYKYFKDEVVPGLVKRFNDLVDSFNESKKSWNIGEFFKALLGYIAGITAAIGKFVSNTISAITYLEISILNSMLKFFEKAKVFFDLGFTEMGKLALFAFQKALENGWNGTIDVVKDMAQKLVDVFKWIMSFIPENMIPDDVMNFVKNFNTSGLDNYKFTFGAEIDPDIAKKIIKGLADVEVKYKQEDDNLRNMLGIGDKSLGDLFTKDIKDAYTNARDDAEDLIDDFADTIIKRIKDKKYGEEMAAEFERQAQNYESVIGSLQSDSMKSALFGVGSSVFSVAELFPEDYESFLAGKFKDYAATRSALIDTLLEQEGRMNDSIRSTIGLTERQTKVQQETFRMLEGLRRKGVREDIVTDPEVEAGIKAIIEEGIQLKALQDTYLRINAPVEKYRNNLEAITTLYEQGKITSEKFRTEIRDNRIEYLDSQTGFVAGIERSFLKLQKESENYAQAIEDVLTNAFQAVDDAIFELVKNGKASFKDLAQSIIDDMTKMAIQKGITQPLMGLLGGFATSFATNAFSGVFAGGAGGAFNGQSAIDQFNASPSYQFPGRATGGQVMAGQPYMVGERGPELFVPSGHGSINNNPASGQSGNTYVTMNIQTPNPDAFRRSESQVKQAMKRATGG